MDQQAQEIYDKLQYRKFIELREEDQRALVKGMDPNELATFINTLTEEGVKALVGVTSQDQLNAAQDTGILNGQHSQQLIDARDALTRGTPWTRKNINPLGQGGLLG